MNSRKTSQIDKEITNNLGNAGDIIRKQGHDTEGAKNQHLSSSLSVVDKSAPAKRPTALMPDLMEYYTAWKKETPQM